MSEEIVVGTQLFMVKSSSYRRISVETEHVTVQKVGRKWLSIGRDMRADKETLLVEHWNHQLWRSEADYLADLAIQEAWRRFHKLMERCYGPPEGVTLNQIENAMRSLFKVQS